MLCKLRPMPRPPGHNVTEVELGSPDYTVAPLNAREKKLLKTPSGGHFHRLLLDAIASARLVFKDLKRTDEKSWNNAPYMVSLGYGWPLARSAKIYLSLSNYRVRLTDRGAVMVVDREHSPMQPAELADYLTLCRKISVEDGPKVLRVLSTVTVQLEKRTAEFQRKADLRIASSQFQMALHRWVRKKMSSEMRADMASLLARYPADALAQYLHELVVEGVHDL
jgi:hypothetical protein